LETKLKIIAGLEVGKQGVIRNMEADLRCYKEVLTEMKTARIQPTLDYFFSRIRMIHNPRLLHFKFLELNY
jgi:hypothetical protein